jgi:ribosomal protein S27AE
MNLFHRIPEQVSRLVIVFSIFILAVALVRRFAIPPELKEKGIHRTSAIKREMSRPIHYAGSTACGDCHEDEFETKINGYHRDLSCEVCHGPAIDHTDEPEDYLPEVPQQREFCPQCHAYNLSRPTGFPQINPAVHNPLDPCVNCHDPHDPEPLETPHECVACHAQISRTKAVSPHVLLDCTTCHETPEEHKISPRVIRPSVPQTRAFCGRCHGPEAERKDTPKIDLKSHGEKYLCWQCHYPHMPELIQ